MKNLLLVLTLFPLLTFCGKHQEKEEKNPVVEQLPHYPKEYSATFYLLRHAEKVRTNPADPDPSLNIEGMLRAKRWAAYFEPLNIDEIYITQYVRTKQTISLIAQQKQISPRRYNPNTIYSEDFLKQTNGKTVIIAGHSNTTPKLVNQLIGEEKFTDMDDADNSTLFKVTINGNNKQVTTTKVEAP
ncbi:phosphoglycerate mutase family protein [Aequorivita sp. SDUM287046]|uniref:Phosphoglycerate mutase family protein n=1 Tax=Aequorivita aurantiaca TaxID=3053356 RepID=A0ABT8DLD4_9FLAO|nr:phosphoglycerate mutase family protein [Aequorivita aurantiaca]MDN3723862.1 phosphoglycerate mutase family protein [Aequorivita aurantiaca]